VSSCTCGACFTSFPDHHYSWCDTMAACGHATLSCGDVANMKHGAKVTVRGQLHWVTSNGYAARGCLYDNSGSCTVAANDGRGNRLLDDLLSLDDGVEVVLVGTVLYVHGVIPVLNVEGFTCVS
jgi:hypothetical protein